MSRQTREEMPGKGGFRKGIDKKEIMKSMTDADWKRINEQKRFESFSRESITAMVALQNDTVRRVRDEKIDNVNQRINNIINLTSIIKRKQKQIDTGIITDELKEGVRMNIDELQFEVNSSKRMIRKEVIDICVELGKLREVVGAHDIVGNVIMTELEYDVFVKDSDNKLKLYDISLFDERVRKFHEESS